MVKFDFTNNIFKVQLHFVYIAQIKDKQTKLNKTRKKARNNVKEGK